jgi:ribose 5-phosphate isomerase
MHLGMGTGVTIIRAIYQLVVLEAAEAAAAAVEPSYASTG